MLCIMPTFAQPHAELDFLAGTHCGDADTKIIYGTNLQLKIHKHAILQYNLNFFFSQNVSFTSALNKITVSKSNVVFCQLMFA